VSALSGLTALQTLDLAGTQVSDVSALSGLTALQWLDLKDTKVRTLAPLAALENLNEVYVSKSDRAAIAKTHPRGAKIVKVRE
jgi:internalin A